MGSFLGCMGYRIPNKIKTTYPSSFCSSCKKPLKWYMNIPLLSFILLKGKCANGNVLFSITNGKVKGQLCVYQDIEKLNKNNIVQNFRKYGEKDDLGGRIGYNDHHGVIDCNPVWAISDKTKPGNLKVKYYSYYADTLNKIYKPLDL